MTTTPEAVEAIKQRLGTLAAKWKASEPTHAPASPEIPPPSEVWRKRFIGLDESHHRDVERMARAAEWFSQSCLRDFRKKGYQLVLAGDVGCGKTHAATRVYEYVAARQVQSWSEGLLPIADNRINAPVFLRWDRTVSWDRNQWESFLHYEVSPTRLVIVDDIGAETDRFKNAEPTDRLKGLLDATERKWLLITTNVPKAKWGDSFDNRVASRLGAARYLSLFEVPDYRPKAHGR